MKKCCAKCGKEFEAPEYDCFGTTMIPTQCDICNGSENAFEKDVVLFARERRIRFWNDSCPLLYRKTDISKLPQQQFSEMILWKFSPKGLGAIGKTGTCKTRCMWEVLKSNCGWDFLAISSTEFAHDCSRLYASEFKEADEWMKKLCSVAILFIDDIGKERMTERVATELYYLIEKRTSNELPILWTSNYVGEGLEEKLGESGAATVRRLREFSKIVSFV